MSGSIGEAEILGLCGSGILVTDFNGGNCNAATGDFSYGVEGLLFENGKVTSPICNMLITKQYSGIVEQPHCRWK